MWTQGRGPPAVNRSGGLRSAVEQGGVETAVATTGSDPGAPLGDLLAAKAEVVAFAANATVIRRQDQLLGSLLDREA